MDLLFKHIPISTTYVGKLLFFKVHMEEDERFIFLFLFLLEMESSFYLRQSCSLECR